MIALKRQQFISMSLPGGFYGEGGRDTVICRGMVRNAKESC